MPKTKIRALYGIWEGLYGGRMGRSGTPADSKEGQPYDKAFVAPAGVKTIPDVFLDREAEETGAMPAWKPEPKSESKA